MDEERKPEPARASVLLRFGSTVGAATLAAALGSLPAAVRAGAGDVDLVRAWLMCAGLAIGPMILFLPIARLAREGLRGFLGGDRILERTASAIVFAGTWLWVLSVLGAALRQKTHQHALAGVTFAAGALVTGVFLALVARRLAAILASLRASRPALATAAAIGAIALPIVALGLRVAHASRDLDAGSRAALVDGLALALALAFFARRAFDDRRTLARLGPPAAFVLLVLAIHLANGAHVALERSCPVHAALLRMFANLAV